MTSIPDDVFAHLDRHDDTDQWRAQQDAERIRVLTGDTPPANVRTLPPRDDAPDDDHQDDDTRGSSPGAFDFEWYTAAEHAAEVDAKPPAQYLVRGLLPEGDYGVLGAEKKAGKTWLSVDLAVSVGAGVPWLGAHPVDLAGPVVMFLGEGGKRKMLRRFRAVCEARGVRYEDLPVHLVFRAPHLTDADHLAAIAVGLERIRPVLVILDPLYLAARGANASQLNEMGAHLERIQHLAQHAGSALLVVHHWNKTGTGTGSSRMSGAGTAEWGRLLMSAGVVSKRTEPDRSTSVILSVEVEGDEVPDTVFRVRRVVRADDPDDLNSPLHYAADVLDPDDDDQDAGELAGLSPAARRVLEVLRDAGGDWLSTSTLGDRLADAGKPLKKRTIQDALKRLRADDLAEPDGSDPGTAWRWRALGIVATPTFLGDF
jgi:hypothetical protein